MSPCLLSFPLIIGHYLQGEVYLPVRVCACACVSACWCSCSLLLRQFQSLVLISRLKWGLNFTSCSTRLLPISARGLCVSNLSSLGPNQILQKKKKGRKQWWSHFTKICRVQDFDWKIDVALIVWFFLPFRCQRFSRLCLSSPTVPSPRLPQLEHA